MQLADDVSITVRHIGAAKRFYSAFLSTLGAEVVSERDDAIGFDRRNGYDAAFLSAPEANEVEADYHHAEA